MHSAVQLALSPARLSLVQASASSQALGQLEIGSQVSPDSTALLSQTGAQSLSSLLLQPAGQQPSPSLHALIAV
jgi:hypothetical protein